MLKEHSSIAKGYRNIENWQKVYNDAFARFISIKMVVDNGFILFAIIIERLSWMHREILGVFIS